MRNQSVRVQTKRAQAIAMATPSVGRSIGDAKESRPWIFKKFRERLKFDLVELRRVSLMVAVYYLSSRKER